MEPVQIIEAYTHILDLTTGTKIFSENPMAVEGDVEVYLTRHIELFFEGLEIGKTPIPEGSNLSEIMAAEDFKTVSLKLADAFIDAMEKSPDIKPCDLVCVLFSRGETEYVAALKLNYKPSFSHTVEMEANAITNKLVLHQTILPPMTQKIEEGLVVGLEERAAYIKDKQVTLDEKRCAYISECIIGTPKVMTAKRAINTATKAAEKIVQQFKDDPLVETAKVRAAVEDMIDYYGHVDTKVIAEKCFETEAEKEAYTKVIEQQGIDEAPWEVPESQRNKIKRTHKIKTSSGVEIVVPYAYMARKENLEIFNNEDGTVSIKLLNLGELL